MDLVEELDAVKRLLRFCCNHSCYWKVQREKTGKVLGLEDPKVLNSTILNTTPYRILQEPQLLKPQYSIPK